MASRVIQRNVSGGRALFGQASICRDPVVCVIGHTGVGKSAFCNTLVGSKLGGQEDDITKREFPESSSINSMTNDTRAVSGKRWLGKKGDVFTIIDTPGLGDSGGKDVHNITRMVRALKEIGSVNAFCILFNGAVPRMSDELRDMLEIFAGCFGPGFFKNAVCVFTHWAYDKKSKKKRKKTQSSEKDRRAEFQKLFYEKYGVKAIPCVFIDNSLDEDDDYDELEALEDQVEIIKHFAETTDAFECQDMKAVKTKNAKLRDGLEKLQREQQEERRAAEARDSQAKKQQELLEEKAAIAEQKRKEAVVQAARQQTKAAAAWAEKQERLEREAANKLAMQQKEANLKLQKLQREREQERRDERRRRDELAEERRAEERRQAATERENAREQARLLQRLMMSRQSYSQPSYDAPPPSSYSTHSYSPPRSSYSPPNHSSSMTRPSSSYSRPEPAARMSWNQFQSSRKGNGEGRTARSAAWKQYKEGF